MSITSKEELIKKYNETMEKIQAIKNIVKNLQTEYSIQLKNAKSQREKERIKNEFFFALKKIKNSKEIYNRYYTTKMDLIEIKKKLSNFNNINNIDTDLQNLLSKYQKYNNNINVDLNKLIQKYES